MLTAGAACILLPIPTGIPMAGYARRTGTARVWWVLYVSELIFL